MVSFEKATLEKLVLHHVGNKANDEKLHLGTAPYVLNNDISPILLKYFTNSFKPSQYFVFSDEEGFNNNFVYSQVENIFSDVTNNLYDASCEIAKHLFNVTTHPNIKAGHLYVTYFQGCYIDGQQTDAVGIFKSENLDTYLKIYPKNEDFEIQTDEGININKLDKGCIVFNKDKEDGYVVSVVDNISKGTQAVYWTDDFLGLMQRQDAYFKTDNVLNIYKSFVKDELPKKYDISMMQQADFLNRADEYFRTNKNFNTENFNEKVLGDDSLCESFHDYKQTYETENGFHIDDDFIMSEEALKKASRYLRSIIKLDKNFTIYVHGQRDMVELGEDKNNGLRYYKFFFKKEQ